MTVKNLYEFIQKVFPSIGQTEIIKLIDQKQKELSQETKLLTARAELSDISTNFAWLLPSDFLEFVSIKAYDEDDKPYYISEQYLEFEIEFGKIYAKSLSPTVRTTIPDAISKIYLHYIKKPATITSISDSLTIDEVIHEGIKAGVLQELFATTQVEVISGGQVVKVFDPRMINYWENQYDKYRIKGKKLANQKKQSQGDVIFYPYAGKFNLPERANDTTVSTITTQPLVGAALLYDKYAILTVIEGQATGTLIGQFGFAGTISATISGNTITVTSTSADFTQGVIRIEHANEYIGYLVTDTSTITFTAETGWAKDTITLIVDKT
jgi:hypothetical protein